MGIPPTFAAPEPASAWTLHVHERNLAPPFEEPEATAGATGSRALVDTDSSLVELSDIEHHVLCPNLCEAARDSRPAFTNVASETPAR